MYGDATTGRHDPEKKAPHMNAFQALINSVRRLETFFPGYFPEAKHNHYKDFGYPDALTFGQFYAMFRRNGLAQAGVTKTILKTWQDTPDIWETEQPRETTVESDIRQRFQDLRFWQAVAEADRRSLVGGYSGLILRYADDKRFQEPVETVGGGLDGLIEVIPAWAGQLDVAEWDTDELSEDYGKPKMFNFNEAAVGGEQNRNRAFSLHPDRVLVWSRDGTVHDRSMLEPGYNALLDLEKISGAGGEGFWKNAKSAPVLTLDKEARLSDMAQAMGVDVSELADKMDEQVDDFQKGFDKLLMLQGMEASTLNVSLPVPEHFFNVSLQIFAASIPMPQKILVGNQTGERASTEDAAEWNATNMARRNNVAIPNIRELLMKFESAGILPERDWHLEWTDLTESSASEKIERGGKMAEINAKLSTIDGPAYTVEEIRAATGYEGGGPVYDDEDDADDDE